MMINHDQGYDHMLDLVPHTIEAALQMAVDSGHMDIREAEECRDAYYSVFDKLDVPAPGRIGSVALQLSLFTENISGFIPIDISEA